MFSNLENASRTFAAVRGKRGESFENFQRSIISRREAVLAARKQLDADIELLRETYIAPVVAQKAEPLRRAYEASLEAAKKQLRGDLDALLDAKRKAFQASLRAPSDEQLRLLQVLRLRDDLTAGELAACAESLRDNYHALQALAGIARAAGLPFPQIPSAEDFESRLGAASVEANRAIDAIGLWDSEMNAFVLHTFKSPGYGTAAIAFDRAEEFELSAAPVINQEKAGESGTDGKPAPVRSTNACRVYLRGRETLAGIADQFHTSVAEIRAWNPDLVETEPFKQGQTLIVPSTRFRNSNQPGQIDAGQVIPVHAEKPAPPPADGEEMDF